VQLAGPAGVDAQLMLVQPILLQKLGTEGVLQRKELPGAKEQLLNVNATLVCVALRPDVAVQAFVIPDVPPTYSHPWS